MAAAMRIPVSKLVEKLLFSLATRSISSVVRSFNTKADADFPEDPLHPVSLISFYNHVKSSPSSNPMDQMLDSTRSAVRRWWDVRVERRVKKDALHLWFDMPGIGKEHVKVSVERSTLKIKGEKEAGRRYNCQVELQSGMYKTGEIRAKMKNGLLKFFVPKLTQEELKKDVQELLTLWNENHML